MQENNSRIQIDKIQMDKIQMDKIQIKRKGTLQVLERRTSGEVEYLVFPMLEKTGIVNHLFSTRLGGVSEAELGSMNLSYSRGDKKENVDENFKRIAEVLGRSREDIVCSDQTHTVNIRKVTGADRGKGVLYPRDYTDIDGLITNEPGIVLATFYADCVPLFFVDPANHAIGLSHSGWRGTADKMGAETIRNMTESYGTNPADVIVAIGPSICQDCYEVSEDVAQFFKEDERMAKADGKYRLDLWKANKRVLLDAGVKEEHISVTDICTCCNPKYLFSHRASHGKRGNLGAFLMLK